VTQKPESDRKIFGIGLSRTGTTSLNAALELLGLRSIHYPADPRTRAEIARALRSRADALRLSVLSECDALTDTPVCCVYQALAQSYPDSLFVLTTRNEDDWLRSCEAVLGAPLPRHWRRRSYKEQLSDAVTRLRRESIQFPAYNRLIIKHLYGDVGFDEQRFVEGRRRYEDGVYGHFHRQPERLLTLDICAGEEWEQLCAFLGRESPTIPFPRHNVRTST